MNPFNEALEPTIHPSKSKKVILLNVHLDSFNLDEYRSIYRFKSINSHYFQNIHNISPHEMDNFDCIIADYNFLIQNDFAWIQRIKSTPNKENSVIIAIKNENYSDIMPPSVLLKNGIDDCYCGTNVNIHDILKRVEFLVEFKKQASQNTLESTDKLDVKTPSLKRLFDIVIALTGIILLSPILILTAIIIALESRGSIIYRSRRIGSGYQEFPFFKFRSMYADSDKRLRDVQKFNQYEDNKAIFIKVKNDPRVTKVGSIIRKYSIDELPQLFNVLMGHMSIIGNRPLPLYEAELLTKEDAAFRFLAPSGITGLWQVTKRGGNNMLAEERINLDITYAMKQSFWFDFKILCKTPFSIIQKENV